jgi:glutamine---fructose-6-phosphate transaminase (isomerizing)
MCGIIGYIGEREAAPVLLNGLRQLEYRGYDSAGLCVHDNGLRVLRRKGRISELEMHPELVQLSSTIGIAHTRWATHGEPCERNAHPHMDCSGAIAVVHNGIIENADAIRTLLIAEGHHIRSETDTEVIAHLVEKFYTGNLEDALRKALRCTEGAFGVALMHEDHQSIIAARKGSPLVIGIGEGEMILASDVTAILPYTKRVVYLNDGELATIHKEGFSLHTFDGIPVESTIHEVKLSIEQIQKGDYKHFMLKEIHEQPISIANTLRGRLSPNGVKLSVTLPAQLNRILIIGCGTSWHAGLIGKYLIEQIADVPVQVDYASEFRYRDPIILSGDLVIAISQSGETADTLAALREAKRKGAMTLGIVNVVGSTITREVDSGIYLHAGPEIGVASTKAFTCQITALTLLALHLRERKGLLADTKLIEDLLAVPNAMRKVLLDTENIALIAQEFVDSNHFLYLGRGVNFPTALEGSLKLKEISYIHAEGYPAAEMKHGPIALIDEHMPVFFIAPKDRSYEKVLSNMEEIRARKGRILAVVTEDDPRVRRLAEHVFVVPQLREELSPLLTSIPLQLFAYYVADKRGLHVDKPRNLAKSVTVE